MSKARSQAKVGNDVLGELIERLGPLNNRWRDGSPPEKVLTLWDIGDVVLKLAPNPSDPMLWAIQERSYITRNLLRYALITRRAWDRRTDLEQLARGLKNFTVFREALPFLKGQREGIDEATHIKVLAALHDSNTTAALGYLKQLKDTHIGRKHQKGAAASAMRDEATRFVHGLKELEAAALNQGTAMRLAPRTTLVTLSQTAVALASGEAKPAQPIEAGSQLADVAEPLVEASKGDRAKVAAFRKAVGAERLMAAADLLNSLVSPDALAEWRRRRGIRLSVP
jgi:hypothetical protein